MQRYIWDNYGRFYFIGIGGTSMSGLAKIIRSFGNAVAGSDNAEGVYTRELRGMGISVEIGKDKGSVKDYDLIVYTDAVKPNDVQLEEAHALNKTVISRGQLLFEVSRAFKTVIAVSGCHGKTTCTSMLAHIFACAGKRFCAHIGGRDKAFCNSFINGFDFFITEACEYKKNFLLLKPDIAVILNTDPDHLECYGSELALKECYARFAGSAERSVTLYGDTVNGETFGYSKNADYYARNLECRDGKYSFTAVYRGTTLGDVSLEVIGKHNVLNALASIATARSAGVEFGFIKQGLAEFTGVERRFELLGSVNGARIIADYAHHPDEIRASVRSAKRVTKGRLLVVFQPHTYSRTKNLFAEFVKVLSGIDSLLIYKTFAAREYFDDSGSAYTLHKSVKKSKYASEIADIEAFISCAKPRDTVLFLGAGDIYDIAKAVAGKSE